MANLKVDLLRLLRLVAEHSSDACSEVVAEIKKQFYVQERAALNNLRILREEGLIGTVRGAPSRYEVTARGSALLEEEDWRQRAVAKTRLAAARRRHSTCSTRRPRGEIATHGRIVRKGTMPILTEKTQELWDAGVIGFCATCAKYEDGGAPDGISFNFGGGLCEGGHSGFVVAPGWEQGYRQTLNAREEARLAEERAARPVELCSCGREINEENLPWEDGRCTTCGNEEFWNEREQRRLVALAAEKEALRNRQPSFRERFMAEAW
jgi:hypothetical protein